MNEPIAAKPTLPAIQSELRDYLLTLAVGLERIYGPHAPGAVLGANPGTPVSDLASSCDISRLELPALLSEAFDYAFHGKLTVGIDATLNEVSGYFGVLSDFLRMVEGNSLIETLLPVAPRDPAYQAGGLRTLVALAEARRSLDIGDELDAPALALLSGISERSVQNALSDAGPKGLRGRKVGGRMMVDNAAARRWLEDKRGFTATTKVGGRRTRLMPNVLATGADLRDFLKRAIKEKCKGDLVLAASRTSLSVEALDKRLKGGVPIGISDVNALANGLGLDEAWFLLQVMRINHPHETEVLLSSTKSQRE